MDGLIISPVADLTGFSHATCQYLMYGAIALSTFFLIQTVVTQFSGKKGSTSASTSIFTSKVEKKIRDKLVLLGPVNSGKTALFNTLLTGQFRETVSSTEVNRTADPMPLYTSTKGENDEPKTLMIEDVPGHYNFRYQMNQALDSARTVIVLVDTKDKNSWPDAADVLYEILDNISALSDGIRVLVACNKHDLTFARSAVEMEREL